MMMIVMMMMMTTTLLMIMMTMICFWRRGHDQSEDLYIALGPQTQRLSEGTWRVS